MGHLRRTVPAVAILWSAACSGGSAAGGPWPGTNVRVGAPTLATQIVELQRGLPNASHGRVLEVADVDGDGAPDVLCGTQLYRNLGRGLFEAAAAGALPAVPGIDAAVFGDLDGDADVDLVVLTPAPRLWRNDGAGGFTEAQASGPLGGSEAMRALALGDADGDGDPGQTGSPLAGLGGFDQPNLGPLESVAFYVDIDEDGVFDVISGVPATAGLPPVDDRHEGRLRREPF